MPGPDAVLPSLPALGGLLAYGPLPGVELFSYFLGLLAWIGLALAAVLQAPIAALFRRLRRGKSAPAAEPGSASVPESAGEGRA